MKTAATTIVLSLACFAVVCALSACGSDEPTPTQTQTTPATNSVPKPDGSVPQPHGELPSPFSDGPPTR